MDVGGGGGTDGGGGTEGGGVGVGDVDDLEGETALATGFSSSAYSGTYCIVGGKIIYMVGSFNCSSKLGSAYILPLPKSYTCT